MVNKKLFLISLILVGLSVSAQPHLTPKQAKAWSVVKPNLDRLAQFIQNNQIDSCLQLFRPEMNRKGLKDSLVKARNGILKLKDFSHNSSGFQELNSKFIVTLIYVSSGFKFLYEIELLVNPEDQNFLFESINLKDTKYFEREYKNPNNTLPPTTPPPPPSNTPPPPPPK